MTHITFEILCILINISCILIIKVTRWVTFQDLSFEADSFPNLYILFNSTSLNFYNTFYRSDVWYSHCKDLVHLLVLTELLYFTGVSEIKHLITNPPPNLLLKFITDVHICQVPLYIDLFFFTFVITAVNWICTFLYFIM